LSRGKGEAASDKKSPERPDMSRREHPAAKPPNPEMYFAALWFPESGGRKVKAETMLQGKDKARRGGGFPLREPLILHFGRKKRRLARVRESRGGKKKVVSLFRRGKTRAPIMRSGGRSVSQKPETPPVFSGHLIGGAPRKRRKGNPVASEKAFGPPEKGKAV